MAGAFTLCSIPLHVAFVPLGLRGQCSAGGGALFADAQALAYPLLHLHLARSAGAELICCGASRLSFTGLEDLHSKRACLRHDQQGFCTPGRYAPAHCRQTLFCAAVAEAVARYCLVICQLCISAPWNFEGLYCVITWQSILCAPRNSNLSRVSDSRWNMHLVTGTLLLCSGEKKTAPVKGAVLHCYVAFSYFLRNAFTWL